MTEDMIAIAEIAHALDDWYSELGRQYGPLSRPQRRMLRLIAAGNANKEIAAQLAVSEETVKGQVSRILAKLGAKDRTHAVVIGLKRGFFDL